MQILTIETDTIANANFLAEFLCTVKSVKSVRVENNSLIKPSKRRKTGKKSAAENLVQEAKEEYNWVNPTRPATDEEIDKMLDACETQYASGLGLPLEKSKSLNDKRISEWKKKNMK